MPGSAFGRTMCQMVCQRVAPRFQLATRKLYGTAWSAAFVDVMITGSVMTPSVSPPARMDVPRLRKSTNAPRPNSACTMDGTPARFTMAKSTTRASVDSPAYSDRYMPASTPTGTAKSSDTPTSHSVPTMAGRMPPLVMPEVGMENKNS